jgi:hypothetical protein
MITRYKVAWDNGASACGVFSDLFDTEDEAEAFGREWADECNLRDFGTTEPDHGGYTFEVVPTADVGDVHPPERDECPECGSPMYRHGPQGACPEPHVWTDKDRALVERIRDRCAAGFECHRDFHFFCLHAKPGETPDETILRVYRECAADFPTWTEDEVIDLMIYG